MIRLLARLAKYLLLAWLLGFAWFALVLPGPAGNERADAIVVLTGGSNRLERGFDLLERGVAPKMLISGVDRQVRPGELAAVYRVPSDRLRCCVTLERQSIDTRSNADEVARWVRRQRVTSIRLVTNDLHMRRARFELGRNVPETLVIISDAVPSDPGFAALALEYHKYLFGLAASLATR